MYTKEGGKVVQIWIVIERIGMTVMRKRVLVLPQDWIAQERHGPYRHVVDPGSSAGGEMARIVAQRAHQPSKHGQQETSQDASLRT